MKHKIVSIVTILIIGIAAMYLYDTGYFWYLVVGVVVVNLGLTALGSANIRWNYFLNSTSHGRKKGVSITFDDGPEPGKTEKILQILDSRNVKATFFLIGHKAEKHPELIKKIISKGHIIGNHSYSHVNSLPWWNSKALAEDINKCSGFIWGLTGKKLRFFRPPFGVTTPRYAKVLRQLGMTSVGWSLRTLDTVAKSKEELMGRIKNRIKDQQIILFHDTPQVTIDILPDFLKFCADNGIEIVPLDEMTGMSPYQKN